MDSLSPVRRGGSGGLEPTTFPMCRDKHSNQLNWVECKTKSLEFLQGFKAEWTACPEHLEDSNERPSRCVETSILTS